uniref:Methyltransferase domain-containing protein n=1 Tax=Megaselia scalaris TaxID=36166 RepID=T1GS90_MEGSC
MNFYPESKDDILYKSEFITTKSENKIEECLKDLNAEESPIGIIGLHSCADLTVTSIRIFLQMERVRKLIVMPCCYHKLKMSDGKFENFPLSTKLQKNYCGDFLNRPFLRLACQETASRWCVMSNEDHINHGINMFQRAALEVLLEKGGTFKKNKMSKISRDITESYKIECENIENLKNEYTMMLENFGSSEFVAEILTCLQATIQRVCENLVLNDRIVFMREVAIERNIPLNVSLRKIVDDTLSPRCFAFIAQKI